VALSFCDKEEFEFLLDIEKLTGNKIRVMENHPYAIKITGPLTAAEKKQANKDKAERKR
jgi:ATP-dependent RNA helicase RhlE